MSSPRPDGLRLTPKCQHDLVPGLCAFCGVESTAARGYRADKVILDEVADLDPVVAFDFNGVRVDGTVDPETSTAHFALSDAALGEYNALPKTTLAELAEWKQRMMAAEKGAAHRWAVLDDDAQGAMRTMIRAHEQSLRAGAATVQTATVAGMRVVVVPGLGDGVCVYVGQMGQRIGSWHVSPQTAAGLTVEDVVDLTAFEEQGELDVQKRVVDRTAGRDMHVPAPGLAPLREKVQRLLVQISSMDPADANVVGTLSRQYAAIEEEVAEQRELLDAIAHDLRIARAVVTAHSDPKLAAHG